MSHSVGQILAQSIFPLTIDFLILELSFWYPILFLLVSPLVELPCTENLLSHPKSNEDVNI